MQSDSVEKVCCTGYWRGVVVFAGVSGMLSVLLGAAAAHWLQATMDVADILRIEKAATYQMYHTLALLILVALTQYGLLAPRRLALSAAMLITGIICFSGSLYWYSFSGVRGLMWVTPIGGIAWMTGWLLLASTALRVKRR